MMLRPQRRWCYLSLLFVLLAAAPALAQLKVFEKEVEEIVGRDQSQEQVEAFALQKAKRLALEEAGMYISSLTVVVNYQLEKDEVTALASGIVHSQVLGAPLVVAKNGIIHVTVKARITVDNSILEQQIKEIMKEKGALKKLEEAQRQVRELENRLADLKSAEVKRLEELNAQALALERDRDRQRLAREEQVLKAQGELKRAELERLQQERELQERIGRTLADQEKARQEEAAAIAREQDRIRRAQLENEQRWNELARKAQITQSAWVLVDDRLSLNQALEEARAIKQEVANLTGRMDSQYQTNLENLKRAYVQQLALTQPKPPPPPAARDPFETTAEYNQRLAQHDRAVQAAEKANEAARERLKAEENLNLVKAETEFFKQKMDILTPFASRLAALQARKFLLPEGAAMTVALGEPEADRNRFPLALEYKGQRWPRHWEYRDRNQARDFYRTRTFLQAEGLFQLEERDGVAYRLTGARVTHPGMGETREIALEQPAAFAESGLLGQMKKAYEGSAAKQEEAVKLHAVGVSSKIHRSATTGMEFILVLGGCFQMGDTFGDGSNDERPVREVCLSPYYLGKYEVTQGQWQKVMGSNPSIFKNCDDCPMENVSWHDTQEFIKRLNELEKTDKYRLPTEAQWEYATRSGGKAEKYAGTSDLAALGSYAWYDGNSERRTRPVGQKQPNGLGFYDLSGNVWEWVQDWYGPYQSGRVTDPPGPSGGQPRVLRGGSWASDPGYVRAANRLRVAPAVWSSFIGFRLSLSAP